MFYIVIAIIIGIIIYFYNTNNCANTNEKEYLSVDDNLKSQYIIVRTHKYNTDSMEDKLYAFPYSDQWYKILKNMHNKTISYVDDIKPQHAPVNATNKISTIQNLFFMKKCNRDIYCDHVLLEQDDEIKLAEELHSGNTFKIAGDDCIGNNIDFYIRIGL